MIDFLKLRVTDPHLIRYIKQKQILEPLQSIKYIPHFKDFDNEVKTKDVYEYKGIIFCFYIQKLEIFFKPHYYFNNDLHNGNDFNVKNCIKVLYEFIIEFDLSDQVAEVMQIEFGLNFIPMTDMTPQQIISSAEYHEKNNSNSRYPYEKRFQKIGFNKGKCIYNTFKIIKFYWKGNQFSHLPNVDISTLRFEVKSNKTFYIKKLGIQYIEDLTQRKIYDHLSDILRNEFKQLLFLNDDIDNSCLSKIENKNLIKYLRSQFWSALISNTKDRNGFSRHKAIYYKILEKTGANLNAKLFEVVDLKLSQLLESGANFNQIQNNYIKNNFSSIGADLNIIKDEICTHTCLVTRLDISMQKDDSFLLSHTGLRYYHKYNNKVFDELKRKFLSNKWMFTDLDIQIKEIAHNIRNYKNNAKIKQMKIYPSNQINFLSSLFNQLP